MQWTKVNIPVESAAEELPFQVIKNYIYITFKKLLSYDL